MKRIFKGLYAPILLAIFMLTLTGLTMPARAIQVSSVSLNVVTKNVSSGGSISFSASDFAEMAAEAKTIRLASLPSESLGVLKIGERKLEVGSTLSLSDIEEMTFCAGSESGVAAMFEVSAVSDDGSEKNVAVVVRVSSGPNYAPLAHTVNIKTYKGVSVEGKFKATDPEGDALTYEISANPSKGSVVVNGDTFVYTPAEGKKGSDVFKYHSVDSFGNTSEEATVYVTINRQKTTVTYSDMEGNGAGYAAARLAEAGVFTGERLGNSYFFSPDSVVSRGDFLALCMRACGIESLDDTEKTGFDDDASIDIWLKPYVSAAVLSDIVGGSKNEDGTIVFNAGRPITYPEAAVILNKALKMSDASETSTVNSDSVPSWAYQATVNLASCGIVPGESYETCGCLTRADVAEMLSAAMDVVEQRGGHSLLGWAKK